MLAENTVLVDENTEQLEAPMPEQPLGIFIAIEGAEGGAVMQMQTPYGKKSAIVAGDPQSDAFKRKVQRNAVRWCKEFFTAPKRAPNKPKEEE